MKFSVKQIAEILGGTVEGNPDATINSFAKIEEGKEGCISFLSNIKYEPYIYKTQSTAVIVANDFTAKESLNTTLIRVENPYLSVSKLMMAYQQMTKVKKEGVSIKADIHESVSIDKSVYVGAFTIIEENVTIGKNVEIQGNVFIGRNAKIGDNCTIYAGVKIMDNCIVGNKCTLHPGAVIGSDGFGFAPDEKGVFQDIPQLGNVVLGDSVSIGANATIDRATMGSTRIANGVKIDNMVQIGHNVEIDENTVIASQTGVSGSTKIGKNCIIAGQVGFAGHLKIADGTKIGAQSGIAKSITVPNGAFAGHPLVPLKQYLRLMITLSKMK